MKKLLVLTILLSSLTGWTALAQDTHLDETLQTKKGDSLISPNDDNPSEVQRQLIKKDQEVNKRYLEKLEEKKKKAEAFNKKYFKIQREYDKTLDHDVKKIRSKNISTLEEMKKNRGLDWKAITAEQKIQEVKKAIRLFKKNGAIIKQTPEFYVAKINEYYSSQLSMQKMDLEAMDAQGLVRVVGNFNDDFYWS